MDRAWLLKRLLRLAALVAAPTSVAFVLVRGWNGVAVLLNGGWPPWVSNVANVVQIATPIFLLE